MASDHEVAFPTLNDGDIATLTARGHLRGVRAGELLFEEGDRNLPFFVVLEGSVEIVGHLRGAAHTSAFALAVQPVLLNWPRWLIRGPQVRGCG